MTLLRIVLLSSILVIPGVAFAAELAEPAGPPLPSILTAPQRPEPRQVPRSEDADAATYEHCMKLAKEDPAAARDLAEHWHDRGGAHPADHCFAVALIGLKQYKEGALRLEKLAEAMLHAPPSLRADVLGQAAQAWLLAGDPARAHATDGAALRLRPGDTDLLIDRAEAAGSAGWFDKAIADLDAVLKADPARIDALIYRASAYRQEGRLDLALADISKALTLAPDSVPALLERGDIRRLGGDIDGARRDWVRVATLAPGSPAEAAAQANIEHLDKKADGPPQTRSGGAR
ncbi:MAG TPA: tetratricopeptide repeat protein [Stellaceae bacterium]|nr:tetratricopeptide repeat protein [Stellaceae bacterium]